ncbi:hypothetical protein J7W08_02215 [Methanococcoides orientis]|uniref:hypothetical protein n=1 Tax=Methanococcoides orientis TaxID=2822137 RepID=UPI001E31488E|nr:hypothetical protein [Methanococcoides orientis]UGV41146.1 hypothetical protein J7W08_02215 [Methanococcoides orientis]
MREQKIEIVNFGIDNEKFEEAVEAYQKFQSEEGVSCHGGKYSPEGKLFVEPVTEYIEYCHLGGEAPIPYDQEITFGVTFFITSYHDKIFFFDNFEDAKAFWNVLDAVDGYLPSAVVGM